MCLYFYLKVFYLYKCKNIYDWDLKICRCVENKLLCDVERYCLFILKKFGSLWFRLIYVIFFFLGMDFGVFGVW